MSNNARNSNTNSPSRPRAGLTQIAFARLQLWAASTLQSRARPGEDLREDGTPFLGLLLAAAGGGILWAMIYGATR